MTEITEFEQAILHRIGQLEPAIQPALEGLSVISREFTGAGSFTNFEHPQPDKLPSRHIDLNALIEVPGLSNGMGAALFLDGQRPMWLETFTFDEAWNGNAQGFEILEAG